MSGASAIILFDGVCNLCHGFVQFVIGRDKNQYFQFASLQSEVGQALLRQHGLQPAITPETVVLLEGGQAYAYSSAVLRIMRHLSGAWRWLYIARVLPRPLRDAAYRFVARHRYQWFGQQEACLLPTPALRQRFL
ncbi:thiol-disulfide oxidoreductase DCC family protein [Hymenobacter taeanensis]|uniref:Thiol-disulfide oxidoreductase DCC family protein n=1 Tax=Hymenobacter taeanensis TaxID=2735321 RepID=A0A6M6BEL8_9BACT|nr:MULTISPECIES: thiol-disulfide oxidoreductase DCC family protein [Hymenobacter]QJX45615.1 thiol-disulfide oxidoreductase DCC family protein [Hymenobacter taeanensis]UOQ79447.1 thiol-disulfide oxidoreductase DCC family protein [Hymenobacter sp. 5414T-23]